MPIDREMKDMKLALFVVTPVLFLASFLVYPYLKQDRGSPSIVEWADYNANMARAWWDKI